MRLYIVLMLLYLPAAGFAMKAPDLPNAKTTPGAINPKITQANINKNICDRHGWSTGSERPPSNVTSRLKRQQLQAWGYDDKNAKDYEEDHLISLEIGGAPADPKNLWPEHYSGVHGARTKDKVEDRLHELVCAGKLTLKQAQHDIASNWIAAYNKYITAKPKAIFHARPRHHLHHRRQALPHKPLARQHHKSHAGRR